MSEVGQLIRSLYTNIVSAGGAVASHSYDTLPDNDDVALTASANADTFGSYAAVVTTVGSADVWLCGVNANTLSAAGDGKIAIATGAAASETDKVTFPIMRAGTESTLYSVGVNLPYPIRVPSGTRVAGRVKTGATTADTVNVITFHATGLA